MTTIEKKINLEKLTLEDIVNLSKNKKTGKIDIQEVLILFLEREKVIENKK